MTTPHLARQRLRSLCEEMIRWLETAKPKRCFERLDGLVREAMPVALASGIRPRPFDFLIAGRGDHAELDGHFGDWPDLHTVEALRFRDPDGGSPVRVFLDARDHANRPHRMAPRKGWVTDRQRVLVILRRRVRHLDSPPPPAEAAVAAFCATHPDAGLAEVLTGTDLKRGQVERTEAWQDHLNDRTRRYHAEHPDVDGKTLARHLGISLAKLSRMTTWQEIQDGRGKAREQRRRGPEPSPLRWAAGKEGLRNHLSKLVGKKYETRLRSFGGEEWDAMVAHFTEHDVRTDEDMKLLAIAWLELPAGKRRPA
jgi:hypothetical protein